MCACVEIRKKQCIFVFSFTHALAFLFGGFLFFHSLFLAVMGRTNGIAVFWQQQDSVLVFSVIPLILTRSIDRSLFYRFNFEFGYFVWYFSALILPLGYLVITWPVTWYLMRYTQEITPQMTSFPKWKLAVMGLFDTLYNLTSTFPVQHIGGNLSNVLSQTVLPINMVFGYMFLKMRFRWNHYLGALIAIGGE